MDYDILQAQLSQFTIMSTIMDYERILGNYDHPSLEGETSFIKMRRPQLIQVMLSSRGLTILKVRF